LRTDCKRNEDILKELETETILDKMLNYKTYWIQHVDTMQRDRLPKLFQNYNPYELRN
jgi:hypothetical protein